MNSQYKEKDVEVKRSVRLDKRNFVDRKAAEVEEAARNQDSRMLFQISKNLGRRKRFGEQGQVRSKDGVILVSEEEQKERWIEHFQEVLYQEQPHRMPAFEEGVPLEIDTSPFTTEEVRAAIGKLKNNKAAGCDGIPAELFKTCAEENAAILGKLFQKI